MFIVQTSFQKARFVSRGIAASRVGVVPGFTTGTSVARCREGGELVTFVGRISREKGIDDFLSAARLLPEIPFAVAGSENGMPGIREGAPDNVQWLGFLGSEELAVLYQRSRIVVLPSRCYESFPNSLLEAMTHGCPVIASRIGAMSTIVEDGKTGFLFEAQDSTDLARNVANLYEDDALCQKVGKAAMKRARTHYSREAAYAALTAVYEAALHGSVSS
jgi:glycosyltransferase involved in cell wall biosynthesis